MNRVLLATDMSGQVNNLSDIEPYFQEYEEGVAVFHTDHEVDEEELIEIECEILSTGAVITSAITQEANGDIIVPFRKEIPPLLIIGGAVVLVVGVVAGWTIFKTTAAGMPIWVWLLGGVALIYLVSTSESGKKAGQAGKAYLGGKYG